MKDEDQPPLADEQQPAAQTAAPVGKSHVAGGAANRQLERRIGVPLAPLGYALDAPPVDPPTRSRWRRALRN